MNLTQISFDRAQQAYDNMDDSPRRSRTQEQQEAYEDWLESKADEARDEKLIEFLSQQTNKE
jgi:hypothetical protein